MESEDNGYQLEIEPIPLAIFYSALKIKYYEAGVLGYLVAEGRG